MIQTGFESRVKIQQVIGNQLPEFILDESPKASEFLKQYYISQEYQGGTVDIAENLDQYLKLDNLIPEVVVGSTTLVSSVDSSDTEITVDSVKGFPPTYGLLKIDNEIITYTSINGNTFTGCIRGFSGITTYNAGITTSNTTNYSGDLLFSTSESASHDADSPVTNLSSLFLKEFYKKLKYSLTPGLENIDFVSDLNVGNFIKEARTLYESKGTEESFRILFNVLFGETPKIINLENNLIKPSSATYVRREVIVAEKISGNPLLLTGQTIKKTTDEVTSASVSEVEIIRRSGKVYYKLLLFIGYDDAFPTVTGNFNITSSTKNIEPVSVGDSVITVDSTIGFPSSGVLYSGNNEITYQSKSINQFFGCSGVTEEIDTASTIRSNDTYYGYENGDTSKKVELRITGVLSNFVPVTQSSSVDVGEEISIKHLGEVVENPIENASYKEIFANSWIYNTSSRYQIDSFSSGLTSQVVLKSEIDKSSLKVGDTIEILNRTTENIIASNLIVTQINGKQVTTNNSFELNSSFDYDIRRKLKFASSSIVPLEYENLTSDIQNVYVENDKFVYVASNSLPSYEITKNIFSYQASSVSGQNADTGDYSIINFIEKVSFYSGSEIYYSPSDSPISGLVEGTYYVDVINDKRQIRLYNSRSFVGSSNYIEFGNLTSGIHTFTLNSQKEGVISTQKILRKFPLSVNIADGESDLTPVGQVGILINGVEISGYKTNDKVYYGPLQSVNVLNGGSGFDVINPPTITPSSGNALLQPIVRGSFEKVYVDPQDFDIDTLVSIAVTGGNGRGASFEPVIELRNREIQFDARQIEFGGGVDTSVETITFLSSHGLIDGQPITYNPQNNASLGIGTFNGSNTNTGLTLKKDATYFAKYISDTTIQLYQQLSDCRLGINTVGFTTIGTSGIHKFATEPKKTLIDVKVINQGSNYENRKLRVKTTGISTVNSTVSFTNHGFADGDVVTYTYQTTGISGLSTSNQYYILKIDDDTFRIANAGIGATNPSNYQRRKFAEFESTGSGYQIFNYPEICLSVEYSAAGIGSIQSKRTIVSTPIVRGEIVGVYVYESGSDYGSSILNLHKKPTITIKNGKNAQLNPVIVNGAIQDVNIQYSGSEYYSTPDIKVTGSGTGAVIKPVITNNKLTDVVIINSGIGYTSTNTTLTIEPAGKNAILSSQVRSITVNKNLLYGEENDAREIANELLTSSLSNLEYSVCGYSENIQNEFGDDGSSHSPIIGWAYDGNPIYGSYGYSDPEDRNSPIKRLSSGYSLNTSNIENRPSSFDDGFFVEDYKFTNNGDLDEYNGRFCVTPEFSNGVYAYFATSEQNLFGDLVGQFPYFIGERYRSKFITENSSLDQIFDFNNSNLIRNTLPYKVNEEYAGNDFIIESNEVINQVTVVESVTTGSVENYQIIDSGDDYKIGDVLEFDQQNTGGAGLSAQISEVTGKEIVDINTSITSYDDAIFTWNSGQKIEVTVSPRHSLENLDYVNVSGFSSSLSSLNGFQQIGVTSYSSSLIQEMPAYSAAGIVTDIYVASIPENLSIGSSIGIEAETLSVLNIFNNVIRVRREATGSAHTATTPVYFIPNTFTINKSVDYFESKVNDLVYFNPKYSVGVGTTSGIGIAVTYNVGVQTNNIISIPTQSIYLPNHPFKTNQAVIFSKPSGTSAISVANTSSSVAFDLPSSGDTQTVYVISQSVDHIGIVTQVGLTTSTNGLFFLSNGSNDYQYSLQSNFTQVKGDIQKVSAVVSVSTDHQLESGDTINLTVNPNLSVGIGTSISIKVVRDSLTDYILVNSIGFNSTGISTSTSTINITSHRLKTGDKIKYSANVPASGLSTGFYFVYKVDDNNIKLTETYIDCVSTLPPNTISIASTGGSSQTISLVNPPLTAIKNNNLVFDLSDSSLSGYNFKIFYDQNFKDEFVSTGSTNSFSVIGVGTVGVSTNASLTINYSSQLPSQLFYNLEKSGYISTADKEVQNYSQINFIDSYYKGSYSITGVGTTTFQISLPNLPENLNYTSNDCDTLEYTTNSSTASGGVSKIRTISPGVGFNKIPSFSGTNSTNGKGAYLIAKSSSIGNINQTRILNEGFEYPSDKTLRPTANIPKLLIIKDSNTISNISVSNGGKNYTTAPDLIIVNSETGEKIDSGLLTANLSGTGIISVNIVQGPKGLPSRPVDIKTINNTNGVGIQTITSSSSGIVTCYLVTPSSGFDIEPFTVGDKIFVEGIQKYSNDGDGFNSENYGYNFFTITAYENGGTLLTRKLEYNLSGLSTNVGIAKTVQESYGYIVNYNNYPVFDVTQTYSPFIIGENLSVQNETGFELQDLRVIQVNQNYIKVSGNYDINTNDVIRGIQSGNIATIDDVKITTGYFNIDYASTQRIGWSDDIGKLDEDTQVIPDNDYYQTLSYSVKSNQEWVDIVTPVNSILHPSGFKNFADTTIDKNVGVETTTASESLQILYDIIDERRVDTINNFDLVTDVDTINNSSRYLKFKNRKLADYIECRTNRVLAIDDISGEFSSSDSQSEGFANVLEITPSDKYNRYLVQIISDDNSQIQFTEIVVINDDTNIYTLEKSSISNLEDQIGDIDGYVDENNNFYLKFTPYDPYNIDYNIKILSDNFTTFFSGIGTYSIGFIDLIGSNASVSSGITTSLVSKNISQLEAIYSNIHILDTNTDEMNYVEIYVDHNGEDTNITEFYIDSNSELSSNFIGSFGASISGGILTLNYTNTSSNDVIIRSKNIGFNTTASGIGTYRFKKTGQLDGYERTVNYIANYSNVSSASTVISLNTTEFTSVKSTVRVSIGNTSALHQVMMIVNGTETYTVQYPSLSIGSTSGIGSFGGSISGSTASLIFYPDTSLSGTFEILSFNEKFYTYLDKINQPSDLEYANIIESIHTANYYSVNSENINRLDFELTYQGYPIFMKEFDPTDSSILNLSTGEFTIPNHFFSTGERLIYTPKTTFLGVGQTSVGIGSTLNSAGIVTNRLPSDVYVYKINNDKFKISTRKDYALAGIYVTFTSVGEGNAHQLEMYKKNEKSIISIDNIIQYPIAYSLITHTLDNYSSIGFTTSTFALSGISSIAVEDLLKVDDEYMKVNNVGFGTTVFGPISFTGSVPLVEVERGFVGSSATSHNNLSTANVYRGSYNIVGNKIFFTAPPTGSNMDQIGPDIDNLPEARSSFNGRVFLRKDYSSNQVYDNISEKFTGIDQSYTLSSQGINTVGLGTSGGSGIVLINGIFQTPTTQNNLNNNFRILENTTVGVSSIVFSGITSSNGSIIISQNDVNLNQLPRGGLIVSLGSTSGLGYAPLVGSSVTAIIGAGGSITSIGIGTTGNWGSGYRNPVSIAITESGHTGAAATISATVGAGGTLAFTVTGGGSGYTNPTIIIPSPNYENLSVTGVSRLGIGSTSSTGVGLLLNVEVGESNQEQLEPINWTLRSSPYNSGTFGIDIGNTNLVSYGNGIYIAAGEIYDSNLPFYDSYITTSTDAIAWTLRTSGFGANTINALTFANNTYVAGGVSGILNTSTDAITWELRTSSIGGSTVFAITYANNVYVAGGASGILNTSTDAISWTRRTSGFGNSFIYALTFANNTYVAGGFVSGGSGILGTSTDSINWTLRTTSFGNNNPIYALTFGNNVYVAGGYGGILNTSTDTITWIPTPSGFDTDSIKTLAFGKNSYVAGGNNGKIGTSVDGINWIMRNSNTQGYEFDSFIYTDNINSIIYDDDNSVFLAAGGAVVPAGITINNYLSVSDINSLSSLFVVKSFKITRPGYGFKKGDVFKPVGLVTAYGLASPVSQFELTVLETFTDSFGSWQFGELDYIDSVQNYQDGSRTRFPLYYNSQLLSFERSSSDSDSQLIDFDSLLIIFINGILQEPKVAYQFEGGTSFTFTQAPKPEDQVSIFFYKGSSSDSTSVDVFESLKIGDNLQVYSNNALLDITTTQNIRTISDIPSSDKVQTNLYTLDGIDITYEKPVSWTKQKTDQIIDGNIVSKSRDSIEPQIYPTAKIIKNIGISDTEVYVDNAQFFNYEGELPGSIDFNALIVSGSPDPVSAAITAIVSAAGTIQSLTINNSGSGYVGSAVTVKISAPPTVGVGIGTVATASISIVNGSLSVATITNPGFGYTTSIVPQVIAPLPDPTYENISDITALIGASGNITGIGTTVGIGTDLAIKFTLSSVNGLSVGYPIYIFDTKVGNGVTSIYSSNDAIIGIGTTFLDNIYNISGIDAGVGIITCNIRSNSSIVGIATTGLTVGKFSWGKLSGFTRSSSPVSIAVSGFTINAGLTTFPTIQRRGYGLRNIGPIEKNL